MNTINLIPQYKECPFCHQFTFFPKFLDNDHYFFCSLCGTWINWKKGTSLERCRILYHDLERLVLFYIQNKSPFDVINDFDNSLCGKNISHNTVRRYFNLFGKVAFDYYENKINSVLLNGLIEIDETLVYKEKK